MALAGTPTNFVGQTAAGSAYLSWSAVAGATGYSIQRSTDGVTFSPLATPSTLTYQDTTVSLGTMYWYQVASTNASGTGVYSSSVIVVPCVDGAMSLYALRLAAQQRADRVNSNFVTQQEWNSYINQSYFELYDILVTEYEDYFVTSVTTTTNGSGQLALPDGVLYSGARPFYKATGVDMATAGSQNAYVSLRKFNFADRNNYVYPQVTVTMPGIIDVRYRVFGSNVNFIPIPQSGQSVRLWYVPRLAQLVLDTDIADGVNGWLEYVIVDAAIKALQKEESDVSVLMAQKAGLLERIRASAMNRDAGQPEAISRIRNSEWDDWSGGWGTGFGGY